MRKWIQLGLMILLWSITGCLPSQYYAGTPQIRSSDLPALQIGELCDIQQLTPSALWQRKLDEIHLSVTLSNYSPTRCSLSGQPNVWVEDQNGFLFTQKQEFGREPLPEDVIWLEPDGKNSVQLEMTWKNWCGPVPKDGLLLILLLPGNPGKLVTMIQDPGGQPLVETPTCRDKDMPSTILVGAFVKVNP